MPSPTGHSRNLFAILTVSVSLACAGCLGHKVHAAAPITAAPQPNVERPMTIAPDTDALPPQETPATPPPIVSANPAAPPLTEIVKPQAPPAPPRQATEQPASESAAENSAHAPAPQISPQISPADQQNYERQTNEEVAATEKNLQQANGRVLNASQQDLLEKARSFLEQARDASKGGDWARAHNLAQKARVLSTELLNSL
jgi:hypothetical protein